VVAGAKVDDEVERAVIEWHRSHIGSQHLCSQAIGADGGSRLSQHVVVAIDGDEPRRPTSFRDQRKTNAAATTDLEHLRVPRQGKEPREQRDLEPLLTPIASAFVRKRPIRQLPRLQATAVSGLS
jgi:hypothetical protein